MIPSIQLNKPSFVPQAPHKAAPTRNVVQFSGAAVQKAGKNGLWISVEREPAMAGGLGQVSKTIPAALNKHLGKDVRVIVPYLAPIKQEGGFEETGLKKTLKDHNGQSQTFRLLQKKEADTGNWVYAIANEKYFEPFRTLYFNKEQAIQFEKAHATDIEKLSPNEQEDFKNKAMYRAIMMFSRAAAAFVPELNSTFTLPKNAQLSQFEGQADFMILHDWHTGNLPELLPENYSIGKIFMFHNNYDNLVSTGEAEKNGIPYRAIYSGNKMSPLADGIDSSHVVIADRNYMITNVKTDFAKGSGYVTPLGKKLENGRIFNVHHVPSEEFNPESNAFLASDGFVSLEPPKKPSWSQRTVEQIKRLLNRILPSSWKIPEVNLEEKAAGEALIEFKEKNKLALQKSLGLKEDKNAVIISWAARFDPSQKGFYLLMNEAKDFLLKHPNAQLVIAGPSNGNPLIDQFIEEMNQDQRFKGRLYMPNAFLGRKEIIRINAGSDFVVLPSLYEPYGLTQLEAYKLGAIPIVHGVDGLRSTVSDPLINRQEDGPDEIVWKYGQTGVKMASMDVPAYRTAIAKQTRGEPLSELDREVLAESQQKFKMAMERAHGLSKNPTLLLKTRQNGMRFVNNEHRWEKIAQRYEAAIQEAIKLNAQETLTGQKLKTSA